MNIFQMLLDFDDQLVDWILHVTPSTDDERDRMRRVLAIRGEIENDLNELVAYRLKLSAAALPALAARLGTLASDMQEAEYKIENAGKVVSAAGEVATIAAKALAFAIG